MTLEALKMGNYGAYVWSSYALALIALVVMAMLARSACKRELTTARRRSQINRNGQSVSSSVSSHEGVQS